MKAPLSPDEAARPEAPRDRVMLEAPPPAPGPARSDGTPRAAASALLSRFSSLRVRLLLIVLLAIVPALGLTLYNGWEQRRMSARTAHSEALSRAKHFAEEFQDVIDEGRHFLAVLARLPEVRAKDAAACRARFAEVANAYPHLAPLGAARVDGEVFCTSSSVSSPPSVADRSYFQRALQTRQFAIGDYLIGRVSGKAVLPLAQPVLDDSGRVQGVIVAPLDLAWLNQRAARARLPEGAALLVIDPAGTILARHPEPEKWVGRSLAGHPPVKAILAQREGVGEAVDADGVTRLYAFTALGDAPGAGARLAIGLPRDAVFREADWILRRNLIALGLVGLLALAMAWVASDALVLRRVKGLLDATRRLAAGDLSARTGEPYGQGELGELARAFDEMATERKRAEEEVERRRGKAEALLDITRAFSSSLELEEVLKSVAQWTARAVGAERCTINLWRDGHLVPVMAQFADGHTDPALWAAFRGQRPYRWEEIPVQAEAIRTRRPVVIEDATTSRFIPASWIEVFGAHSILVVPMIHRDEVIGTLYLDRTERPAAWRRTEVDLAMTIANQAALAVVKAELFDEAEGRRRAAEGLAEVARLLSSSLDPDEVGRRIVDSVQALLDVKFVRLLLLHPESGHLLTVAVSPQLEGFRAAAFSAGIGLAGLVVRERCPVATADLLNDPRITITPEVRARVEALGLRAGLAVPLVVQDRLIGALSAGDAEGRAFDDDDVRLAQAFADQAAVALENARLYAESSRRQREAESLARVAQALTGTLDVATAGERVVEAVLPLFNAQSSALRLLQPDSSLMGIAWAGTARDHFQPGHTVATGMGVIGRAASEGRPVQSPDVMTDPDIRLSDDMRRHNDATGVRAVLAVPLRTKDRVIGALSIGDQASRRFSEAEVTLLQAFADQVALALENARLYAEAEGRRREAEVVAELTRAINASLDLDTVLQRIAEGAMELCRSDLARIALRNPDKETMTFRYWAGGRFEHWGRLPVEPGMGVGGQALLTGRPFRTDHYTEDPRISKDYLDVAHAEGMVAVMAVPIWIQNRIEGLLFVDNRSDRPFTDRDEAVLVRLAEHASTTIQNARLFQEQVRLLEETQRQHLEAVALEAVGREITSSLDRQEVLQRIVDRARDLCGCDIAYLAPYDPETGTATIGAASGARSLVLFGVAISRGRGLGGKVLETGEAFMTEDYLNDPRISQDYADSAREEGTVAEAVIPLRLRGAITGLLGAINRTPRSFAARDLSVLTRLADQAAIALENSRLFEQVRKGRERLQALSRRLVEVQEAERRHVARELHDEIGQVLTGLKLSLEMSARTPGALDEAQTLVQDLMTRVRDMSLELRPAMLDDLGLLPTLLWHFERYSGQTGVRVEFEHGGLERRFPSDVETAAYRIVQEALTNVARHAGVSGVTVWVWAYDDALNVHIEDRGRGFDPESASATGGGLSGMRERAILLGGHLNLASKPGAGTQITAGFPLEVPLERRRAER